MKTIYYPPAFLLSRLYAWSLNRRSLSPEVDKPRYARLVKAVRTQMFSPRRNGVLELTKHLLAAYFIAPGDVAIDVGTHLGGYTAYYSSLVGQTGRIHAYEAHPLLFQKMKARFKNTPQVSPHNFAVSNQSDRPISMQIYPEELQHGSATVEPQLMNAERMPGKTTVISVPCQKLDVHLDEAPGGLLSLIKIDVEGHEHAVIKGALNLIRKHQPVVIYEYGYVPGQFEPTTIEQMNELGYLSYDCKTLESVRPKFVSLVPTDLVAVPKTRLQEFERLVPVIKNHPK